jgi:hypothetical protein
MKILTAHFLAILLAGDLLACKVPVFRYALERWPADSFRLLVGHQGPLDPLLQGELDALRESLETKPLPINLTLETLDLATLSEAQRISIPGLEHLGAGPSMVLFPPESWRSEVPVWTGPATAENLALLLDSPARQRCADHLLNGETTVWLLVPSGDPEQDDQARAVLAEGLQTATETIEIPEGVIRREDLNQDLPNIDLDDVLRSDLPLKISFVADTVSRDDPAEALFLAILLGPSPPPAGEPLIVPVFGRGRTAGPVPISRLTAERVVAACEYFCGSCSCQVKQGNPGFDLLFQINWDKLLNATVLTADSEIVQQALDVVTFGGDDADEKLPSETDRPNILAMTITSVAAILLFFGAMVWVLVWQRRKRASA